MYEQQFTFMAIIITSHRFNHLEIKSKQSEIHSTGDQNKTAIEHMRHTVDALSPFSLREFSLN